MLEPDWWVDHAAHELHCGRSTFPCDRDVEAMAVWAGHALLLSSDTDCLSLWDGDGIIRTVRVGVYPQDMAVAGDCVAVCGGADGRIHLLDLPGLHHRMSLPLPGMPERIALQGDIAHVLALLTEPDTHTLLISADVNRGSWHQRLTLPGIPGALATDDAGLWIGVSGQVLHLPHESHVPDLVCEGFELPGHIEVQEEGVIVTDALRDCAFWLQWNRKERPSCDERPVCCTRNQMASPATSFHGRDQRNLHGNGTKSLTR